MFCDALLRQVFLLLWRFKFDFSEWKNMCSNEKNHYLLVKSCEKFTVFLVIIHRYGHWKCKRKITNLDVNTVLLKWCVRKFLVWILYLQRVPLETSPTSVADKLEDECPRCEEPVLSTTKTEFPLLRSIKAKWISAICNEDPAMPLPGCVLRLDLTSSRRQRTKMEWNLENRADLLENIATQERMR